MRTNRKLGWTLSALGGILLLGAVSAFAAGGAYDFEFRDADIKDVLRMLADQEGVNLLVAEGVTGRVTASFRGVTFREVMTSLMKMGDWHEVQDGPILRVEKRSDLVAKGEALERRVVRIQYGDAGAAAAVVTKALTQDGSVTVDTSSNSLLLRDRPEGLEEASRILAEIDRFMGQVMIEARILETSSRFARELGLRWGFQYTHLGGDSTFSLRGSEVGGALINLPSTPTYGGLGFTFGKLDGTFDLDFELTAMEDKGMGKILSSPRIATLDNREATIKSGVRIPLQTTSTTNATTSTDVSYVDALLTLTVTPHVASDGKVLLSIHASRSEPDWTLQVKGNPSITTREASTRLMVKDGETVVIGGLKQEKEYDQESRIPFLSGIPVVGNLFKNQARGKDQEELLILITPKVISL